MLLSGEPGIGKSRLVRALRERLEDEPHVRLLYQCSPHHTTSALYPGDRAAGARRRLRARRSARGQARQARGAAGARHRPAGRGRAADRCPARHSDRRSLPGARPDPAAPEAAHPRGRWSTSSRAWRPGSRCSRSTRTCTGSTRRRSSCSACVIERVQRLPVLVLITFRPEFSPPWTGARPRHRSCRCRRLGRRHGAGDGRSG